MSAATTNNRKGGFQERTISLLSDFSQAKERRHLVKQNNNSNGKHVAKSFFLGHGLGLSAYTGNGEPICTTRPSSSWATHHNNTRPKSSGQRPKSAGTPRLRSGGGSGGGTRGGNIVRPRNLLDTTKAPVTGQRTKMNPREEGLFKSSVKSVEPESDEYKRLYKNIAQLRGNGVKRPSHSSNNNNNDCEPADGVVFVDAPNGVDVQIVYRTSKAKARNHDRLNLDRKGLKCIPIIENEPKLRLLNFQHNTISHISNLNNVSKLVFLDLYNNKLDRICNLEGVPSLRVLMLGRNLISTIENLDSLTKLDVLDLHANRISVIGGLSHLQNLRVLNLAANKLEQIDDLSQLKSLTELNLRRNEIETVSRMDELPLLKHLFLSNNRLAQISATSSVFNCTELSELTLDGNDELLKQLGPSIVEYRLAVLERLPTLKCLDLVNVQEEERRSIKKSAKSTSKTWNDEAEESNTVNKTKKKSTSGDKTSIASTKSNGRSRSQVCTLRKWNHVSQKLTDADYMNAVELEFISQRLHEREQTVDQGYHEVQSRDGERVLLIYGSEFSSLDNDRITSNIDTVELQYATLEEICSVAFPKIKSLQQISAMTFAHTNIKSLYDLAILSTKLPRSIASIRFKFNPITSLELYRPWLVFHLLYSNVLMIDGVVITQAEKSVARNLFKSIAVRRYIPKKLSLTSSKTQLLQKRQFISHNVSAVKSTKSILTQAIAKAQQDKLFEQQFETLVRDNILQCQQESKQDADYWFEKLEALK